MIHRLLPSRPRRFVIASKFPRALIIEMLAGDNSTASNSLYKIALYRHTGAVLIVTLPAEWIFPRAPVFFTGGMPTREYAAK